MLQINETTNIPLAELTFRFSTSSGPGGQHANRSATRVTLRFDVLNSPSLDEEQRARILDQLSHRLDREGIFRVQVQDTRSQKQNREIAISRFMVLLTEALDEPKERVQTKPPTTAEEKRLSAKKKTGRRKRERGRDWSQEA